MAPRGRGSAFTNGATRKGGGGLAVWCRARQQQELVGAGGIGHLGETGDNTRGGGVRAIVGRSQMDSDNFQLFKKIQMI
jgi:hypothetical protein